MRRSAMRTFKLWALAVGTCCGLTLTIVGSRVLGQLDGLPPLPPVPGKLDEVKSNPGKTPPALPGKVDDVKDSAPKEPPLLPAKMNDVKDNARKEPPSLPGKLPTIDLAPPPSPGAGGKPSLPQIPGKLPEAGDVPTGNSPSAAFPPLVPFQPEPESQTGEPRAPKQQAAVQIEWVSPPGARLGQAIPCQLMVRNTSSAPVHHVVVRLPLGEGATCKLTEPVAASEGGVLTWSLGTMQASQTHRLEMHLVSTTRGALACQAQATFTTTVANMIYIREPMLALKLRMPDKIVAGEPVTVALTASNPGDGPTESIKLRLQLPDGLEHPRGRIVDVELGDLSPKDSRTVQVVCRAKTGGVHKCQASASADNNLSASDAGQIEVLVPRLDV